MTQNKTLIALDVGEKRIGVAIGQTGIGIAIPFETISVDGTELERIAEIVVSERVETIVIGYPRNQSGEPTGQTRYVETFAQQLTDMGPDLFFQDESLTSVQAEQELQAIGKPYQKGDIDAQAARIILQDYLEASRG